MDTLFMAEQMMITGKMATKSYNSRHWARVMADFSY